MRTLIIPVIHYEDEEQTLRNAEIAARAGCAGVMLIHMEGRDHLLPDAARAVKRRHPDLLVGLNRLNASAAEALEADLANGFDMTWSDDQPTHSDGATRAEAALLGSMLAKAPGHIMFVGIAFKHQPHEPNPVAAAREAIRLGLVPTTSGPATGVEADVADVERLRRGIGPDAPLAIASGITPGNVASFSPHLSHVLVATGVSRSFHEFDAHLLDALMSACVDSDERHRA